MRWHIPLTLMFVSLSLYLWDYFPLYEIRINYTELEEFCIKNPAIKQSIFWGGINYQDWLLIRLSSRLDIIPISCVTLESKKKESFIPESTPFIIHPLYFLFCYLERLPTRIIKNKWRITESNRLFRDDKPIIGKSPLVLVAMKSYEQRMGCRLS